MAKPWPERPVSAANRSGEQWRYDEKVPQSALPMRRVAEMPAAGMEILCGALLVRSVGTLRDAQ